MVTDDSDRDSGGYSAEFDVGRLYVWGVSLLIGFIGYSSQICVYWSYLGGATPKSLLVLGAFNFMLLLLYYNYYLAVTVAPGHVPLGWEPPRTGANVYELKRDTHKPRYCRQCRAFKPPRAHHCTDCERCVLKMDHHCPWTNNCVGYHNQAHFLRFVYTVDVTCVFALALHGLRLWELVVDSINGTYYVRQPTQAEVAFLIINMTLAGLVLLFVGILSGYHAYLVGSNTTTIESREKSRVEKLVRQRKCQPTPYPYNLGVVPNFRSVFGPNILTWWVPRNMSGDGLNFSIGPGLTAPVYWPPLGYTRENAVAEVAPRTVFHGKDGARVVSEMDADGEMVLRNYNASADLATLENGGTAPLKMDSGGDDDKSEAGDIDYDLDESTDSDDDICDAQPSYARTSAVARTTSTVQRRTVFSATTNARGSDYVRRYAGYASESDSDNQPLIRKQQ